MNIKVITDAFKTPQGVVSVLAALVAIGGTVGILNTSLSNALQTLLTAILGVIVAVTHGVVVNKITERKLADQAEVIRPTQTSGVHRMDKENF